MVLFKLVLYPFLRAFAAAWCIQETDIGGGRERVSKRKGEGEDKRENCECG